MEAEAGAWAHRCSGMTVEVCANIGYPSLLPKQIALRGFQRLLSNLQGEFPFRRRKMLLLRVGRF